MDTRNPGAYQADLHKMRETGAVPERDMSQYHETVMREFAEKKHQEEEREARRLQLILEKRRKKKP